MLLYYFFEFIAVSEAPAYTKHLKSLSLDSNFSKTSYAVTKTH